MARKPLPKPIGTRIPPIAEWQRPWWRVVAMMARIPEAEYQTVAAAFQTHHETRGTLAEDWMAMWKTWCGDEGTRRFEARRAALRVPAIADKGFFEL